MGDVPAWRRVTQLLDGDSVIEYGELAGASSRPDDQATADGLITVTGTLAGAPMLAVAFDETVLDGTQSERNMRKLAKMIFLAHQHR